MEQMVDLEMNTKVELKRPEVYLARKHTAKT